MSSFKNNADTTTSPTEPANHFASLEESRTFVAEVTPLKPLCAYNVNCTRIHVLSFACCHEHVFSSVQGAHVRDNHSFLSLVGNSQFDAIYDRLDSVSLVQSHSQRSILVKFPQEYWIANVLATRNFMKTNCMMWHQIHCMQQQHVSQVLRCHLVVRCQVGVLKSCITGCRIGATVCKIILISCN